MINFSEEFSGISLNWPKYLPFEYRKGSLFDQINFGIQWRVNRNVYNQVSNAIQIYLSDRLWYKDIRTISCKIRDENYEIAWERL